MSWKFENKTNLWSDCVAKGHIPVVVAVAGASINVYCSECRKIWRVATLGKLQSMCEDDLPLLDDTVWKRKVLSLISEKKA